jgi:hypothetical protein
MLTLQDWKKEEELGNQSDELEQKDLYQWYKIIASNQVIRILNILLISFSYLCNL